MKEYLKILTFGVVISLFSLKGFCQKQTRIMSFLESKPKVLVFSADWCLPCKVVKKWMNEDKDIISAFSHYDVRKYDFDVDKTQVAKYNIKRIPTFVILKNDELITKVGIGDGKKGLELFLLSNRK